MVPTLLFQESQKKCRPQATWRLYGGLWVDVTVCSFTTFIMSHHSMVQYAVPVLLLYEHLCTNRGLRYWMTGTALVYSYWSLRFYILFLFLSIIQCTKAELEPFLRYRSPRYKQTEILFIQIKNTLFFLQVHVFFSSFFCVQIYCFSILRTNQNNFSTI